MIELPADNIVLINEEYTLARPRKEGRGVIIELSGTFASASFQPGYKSVDGLFIADGTAKTAAGRFELRVPESGYPMFKVTAATGSTEVLVTVSDVKNL